MFFHFNKKEDLDLGRFSQVIKKSLLVKNSDGTYDYHTGLNFSDMGLNSLLEIPVKFKEVYGYFNCSYNNLVSLEDAPEKVAGYFDCSFNQLISLQYAPLDIAYDYTGSSRSFSFDSFYNNLLSKVYNSKFVGRFDSNSNPFCITGKVISSVKRMTFEQQMKELEFFRQNDSNAYEIMKKILKDLNVNLKGEEFQMCYTIK